jgi:hypothetical protein
VEIPPPCGPLSTRVVEVMSGRRPSLEVTSGQGSVLDDRDVQLALWLIYELSYRGFDGVDLALEWDPDLVRLRLQLEQAVEHELRTATQARVENALENGGDVGDLLLQMVQDDQGPPLAAYLRRDATLPQLQDFLRERSVQQLKESDPQAFLLPRLRGEAKVALAELQYDEFGAGRPERLHQTLYAQSLVAAGLDPGYGAYVADVSAMSLASTNVMSMFGLNRRLLAAGCGHFAAFEASSAIPSRRIAAGLDRVGLVAAAPYFDEHVEADAVHEQIAARDVCGALVADDPGCLPEVLFGAACVLHIDALSATELMTRWAAESAEAPTEVAS